MIIFFIIIQHSSTAEEHLVFGDIIVSPLEPTPFSVVNFTVAVNSNISVDEVRLIVQECTGDMCFLNDYNVSMNYSYRCCMDFYETQIALIHKDATQIKYYAKILNNGTWYASNRSSTNLSTPISKNPVLLSEHRSLPGFELMILFCSAGFLLIGRYYKFKKR